VGRRADARLTLLPSEYWARPVPRRVELHPPARGRPARSGGRRPNHVGQRFPHKEGCWAVQARTPAARVRRRRPVEVRAMVGGNAARVYGFRSHSAFAPIAARVGPSIDDVAQPWARRDPDDALRCHSHSRSPPRRADNSRGDDMGRVRYGARTPEELTNPSCRPRSVGAWATSLVATYETDPEIIAAVLPPPLEPSEPAAGFGERRDGRSGARTSAVGAGSFAVQARTREPSATTRCSCRLTTEQSVVGGRETFGEPRSCRGQR